VGCVCTGSSLLWRLVSCISVEQIREAHRSAVFGEAHALHLAFGYQVYAEARENDSPDCNCLFTVIVLDMGPGSSAVSARLCFQHNMRTYDHF
jgi:hypothetical protein